MVRTKVSAETVVGDAIAMVTATLLPGPVVRVPMLRTMLPPSALLDTLLLLRMPGLVAPRLPGIL